jgi:hypothetical protein
MFTTKGERKRILPYHFMLRSQGQHYWPDWPFVYLDGEAERIADEHQHKCRTCGTPDEAQWCAPDLVACALPMPTTDGIFPATVYDKPALLFIWNRSAVGNQHSGYVVLLTDANALYSAYQAYLRKE